MPPTRSNTNATVTSSPNASASPEPQPSKEIPERSRNAKAQARHREKRKAYISHLEQSVASLKQQLASMGISGAIPAHALATSSSSTGSQAETDARLRELVEENERLKSEIQRLRSKVESMGGSYNSGASASSRSSTGGHHGLTPPATPGVLGGLGSTGGLLPASSSADDGAYDGRRGSVMGGPVESFLEGHSAQNTSHHHERAPNASTLFPSSSSSSQVPLSLHIPSSSTSSAQPQPTGLGISGLSARPLSAGSHLAQHRYSLPSPLPSALSSSSTPLLPPPNSSYTPSSSTPSSSSSQFNPSFRVQSPFGTPVDPSSGWQIPRGSAPSIISPGFLDYPPRGRELPLPAGFGLAPLASIGAGGAPPPPPPAGAGYDYLMVSAVRGSGPGNGLGSEFPSAVPPLASTGNVLPPFYGGNGGADPASSTLPPFSATTSAASAYSYYGLPPNHQAMQHPQQQQQQQSTSAPPSRANSQSRNETTGSSSSSSPKSLSPGSPIVGATAPVPPFGGAGGSFKMQLESGGGNEFGSGQGFEFGLSAATAGTVGAEQGQQWA